MYVKNVKKYTMLVKAQCMKCKEYLTSEVIDQRTLVEHCLCESSSLSLEKDRSILIKGFCEIKFVLTRRETYCVIWQPLTMKSLYGIKANLIKYQTFQCKTCGGETKGVTNRVTCFTCKEARNRKVSYKNYIKGRHGLITTK
jgi:Zn finger protein HypA/HybF involved in hydrogenase expression